MADNSPKPILTLPVDKAAPAPETPQAERTVKIKLLSDYWMQDPANPKETIRLRTNTLILDDDGNPIVDRKTKNYMSKHECYDIPVSQARALIDAGKAERLDPL